MVRSFPQKQKDRTRFNSFQHSAFETVSGHLPLAPAQGASSKNGEFCFLPRNFVASFPYNYISPNLVMSQVKMTIAKQVAQECSMKAAYYRREFTQQAWRETIVAALLIPSGLILFVRAPAAGFFLFMCGAVAARAAYTSFQYACTAYGEYKELPEDHN
jgi:hypothetical protein